VSERASEPVSREEDLVRSTTRAIASSVREVPPLRLEPAAGKPRSRARARRRLRDGGRSGWWTWGAPLAAAAVVVALAIALVVVRDMPGDRAIAPKPASTAGPGGAPRYFTALKGVVVKAARGKTPPVYRYDVVVADSLTGKTLATVSPPAHTVFQSVSAAADDRTFVVFAVSSATDPMAISPADVTLTGSWYKLLLAPGTAHPARLSPLPVRPWSWVQQHSLNPTPGQIYATALSQSGRELAVADIPDVPGAATKTGDWHEVKVFSVATGRLLRDWTENNPAARLTTGDTFAGVPAGTPALTWIDGDRALALATSSEAPSGTTTGTIRRLNVATGPARGNLMTDATVIWSGNLPWNQSGGCRYVDNWPPPISADGNTVSCVTIVMPHATPGQLNFSTYPLPAGTTAGLKPRLDYRATIPPEKETGGTGAGILWVSPTAGTLIIQWEPGGIFSATKPAYFGVASHGKFTPLPIPKSFASSLVQDITF
jgi:hypothetical protein